MGEPGRRLDSCSATPHPTISGVARDRDRSAGHRRIRTTRAPATRQTRPGARD